MIFVYDTRDTLTGHTFAVDNVLVTATPEGCGHLPAQPDADGDFHPDALCGGDDCDDGDPSVWGIPAEITGLRAEPSSPTDLTWDSLGFLYGTQTLYDFASGALLQAPRIDYGAGVCLQSGTATSHADVRGQPPPGSGYWYLVRAQNACGSGTYGSAAADLALTACP